LQSPSPSPSTRPDARAHTAGAVAHDVNNLLHVILGCCERLRSGVHLSHEQSDELQHIMVAAEHAAMLTGQVLAPGSRTSTATSSIDLHAALGRLKGLLERVVGDTITFDMRLPAEHVRVRMDEADMAQVLVNLAVNAREAMSEGGQLSVVASVVMLDNGDDRLPRGRYVRLEVTDSGAGMTADVRERAFEQFFTTKTGEGGGHGLAIVQANVQRHGGTVEIRSEPGRGTQFVILLPVAESHVIDDGTRPTPRARAGETVLVVDDEPMARDVIVSFLQGLGYATVEAGSGREAIVAMVRRPRPVDLLVVDMTMPDMTGLELAARARELTPHTPALLISGDSTDSMWEDGRMAAIDDFLQKPFNSRSLGIKVRSLLDASHRERATVSDEGDAPALGSGASLLDGLPTAAFVVQRGRFIYANAAFAQLTAVDLEDVLGRDCLERVHPDDRDLFPVESESSAPSPSTTQVRLRCGDGAERSLALTSVTITHGHRPALLALAVDVTIQPDASLIAVRLAALGRLAGGIAHDFNNLLLVMGGHLERLQQRVAGESELRPDLDAIGSAARRAATLTDQLLSFGRRQLLSPEVQDLGTVVELAAGSLRSMVGPTIDLVLERAPGVPPIEVDTPRLREVLWHLVENAREAMPSGGTVTIVVDAIEVDRHLESQWAFLKRGLVFTRLRVIDTGRGMEPGVAAHAFEPFFTTKAKGRGFGMGLASVYGIVKQSGGYVFAERTGEGGTCMTMLLPPAVLGEGMGAVSSGQRPEAGEPGGGHRIRLGEDDDGVRELLVDVLRSRGYEVTAAAAAEEALERAREHPFDLLLSDVDLPAMNGARLARTLRERHPGLRIVLMSGYPDDGTIDGELSERPMFLRKPFGSALLIDQVRAALSQIG
jgi:PAS domain S-box-containing protein